MLLFPFRINPIEVDKTSVQGPSLYYGTNPSPPSDDTLHLGVITQTMEFFSASLPIPPVNRYLRVAENRIPVLFEGVGDTTYDAVATAYYFLSGWQEVHTTSRDEHGRFRYEDSIQHATGTVDQPTVDWYRHLIADLLRQKGLKMERKEWGRHTWTFCPTHDIDYDKKWRAGIYKRELLDRTLLNSEHETGPQRLQRGISAVSSLFSEIDPFRAAFIRMQEEVANRDGKATYFIKSGGSGLRDVPYLLRDPFVFEQLKTLSQRGFEIGHHPSYHAYLSPEKLSAEKAVLESVCGFEVTSHRAHYLRYTHPTSAYQIHTSGFSVDSSLGFATMCGFRHATCLPFPLFDPKKDVELGILEAPLVCMESALFNRMNLDGRAAEIQTQSLMQTCAQFGGMFVGLWHNTLWDESDYPGWGDHFVTTLEGAQKMNGQMESLKKALKSWQ
ncbi:MAG: hypothetical protein O3B41_09415 [Bacteroidetes bacterium]|nr:hypothetical protein [Bacteroidota bacterium]